MKVHEYQAKRILAEFGVPVPRGRAAASADDARAIAAELGDKAVVKAPRDAARHAPDRSAGPEGEDGADRGTIGSTFKRAWRPALAKSSDTNTRSRVTVAF